MDNPYWDSQHQSHVIDVQAIKLNAFHLLNIFESNRRLNESTKFEISEEYELHKQVKEDGKSNASLLSLHYEFCNVEISRLLINIAINVRIYDEQMTSSSLSKAYKRHINKVDDGNLIGCSSDSEKFTLRRTCNKIIHTNTLRPLYEKVDNWYVEDDQANEIDIWYLTGVIELSGKYKKDEWDSLLHVQAFIEVILDVVKFSALRSFED